MANRTTAVADEPDCYIHYLLQQCGFDFVQIAELVLDWFPMKVCKKEEEKPCIKHRRPYLLHTQEPKFH